MTSPSRLRPKTALQTIAGVYTCLAWQIYLFRLYGNATEAGGLAILTEGPGALDDSI